MPKQCQYSTTSMYSAMKNKMNVESKKSEKIQNRCPGGPKKTKQRKNKMQHIQKNETKGKQKNKQHKIRQHKQINTHKK